MTEYVNVTKRAMCGDAGNPQIHVFVRDYQAPASHYNAALQQEIAQERVNAQLNQSQGQRTLALHR